MSPSEDYAVDCRTGEEYAVAYLRYRAIDKCTAPSLPSIVADQTRDLSGIEDGFLSMIDYASVHGLISGRKAARLLEGRRDGDEEARETQTAPEAQAGMEFDRQHRGVTHSPAREPRWQKAGLSF